MAVAAASSVGLPHVLANDFSAGVKFEKNVFSARYFLTPVSFDTRAVSFVIRVKNFVKDSPISRLRVMFSIFFSMFLASVSSHGLPIISSIISKISAGMMMSSNRFLCF